MIDYNAAELEVLRRQMNDMRERIGKPGFFEGSGVGNNYPSFVFPYKAQFEPLMDQRVRDLETTIGHLHPGVQVTRIHLFEFARQFLQDIGKWDKSLELELTKGEDFLFINLPKTLNGKVIADYFLEQVLLKSPGLILIHGVGMAWPILRGHEVLKNLPEKMNKKIPLILFYPGEYDGKYLRPFGLFDDSNEYQAMPWPYS